MKNTTTALTVLVSLAIAEGAMANFDFESPTYTNGTILGQDAWTDANNTAITTNAPIAGGQSAISTDISPTPNIYAVRNITGLRTWADGTRISALFRTENNGTGGSFFDFRFDTFAGYLADVTVNSWQDLRNVVAYDGNAGGDVVVGSITEGTTYQIIIEFNFTADTYDAILQTVNSSDPSIVIGTVGSALDVPFANASSAADANASTVLRLRAQNGGDAVAGAAILWDNVLIESTNTLSVDATAILVEDALAESFDTEAGFTYRLQSTPDLVSSNYADVGVYVEGNDQTQLLFDPEGPSTQKNYRVVSVPD